MPAKQEDSYWSHPGRVPRLIELWADAKLSASMIANVMSQEFVVTCTRNMILSKRARMNLPTRAGTVAVQPPRAPRRPHEPSDHRRISTRRKLPALPQVAAAVQPDPVEPEQPPIGLLALNNYTCRFVVSGDTPAQYLFCGGPADVAAGRSWCDRCARVVFHRHQPPPRAPAKPFESRTPWR